METSSVVLEGASLPMRLAGVPFSIAGTLLGFSSGTAGIRFELFSPGEFDLPLAASLLLAGLLCAMALKGIGRGDLHPVLLLMWIFLPLSFLRPSSRHFALAFAPFMILAGQGLSKLKLPWRRFLPHICLAAMLAFQFRFASTPVMPQRCTFDRDLREAAAVSGAGAHEEGCAVIAFLDHYTSMALLLHLEDEGWADAEVWTPFDGRFERDEFFIDDLSEVLAYLQHDTDSLVRSWLEMDQTFVLLANDPERAFGRVHGSRHSFIGMGSDVMSDLDLMEVLRQHTTFERIPLKNSHGPFSVFLVRGAEH